MSGRPRPSRAGQPRTRKNEKRTRQPETRLHKLWPTFLNTPWDLWAVGADFVLPKPALSDAVIAQQDENVRHVGAQAAFHVAVAQGEIDDQTQQWLRSEVCRQFAAFELFKTRSVYTCPKLAMHAWKRLSPCDMSNLLEQVDDKVVSEMFGQMHARRDKLAAALVSSDLFGDLKALCEAAVAAPPAEAV